MKLLPRLADEDELDRVQVQAPVAVERPAPAPLRWTWTLVIAAVAAIPRLLYVFVLTNPENPGDGVYDDVWHHWQIAYLTKQVGLTAAGGPRLWDLKGMEYIWGPLHPLLMAFVFAVTGSVDIVLDRLVSALFGVATVVLLFHLCRAYWGNQVAAAAALFAALLPTSVMNDASGMVEPIAIAITLFGIWAWSRPDAFWSGVGFALAAFARAEEWIFSLGLVVAAFLRRDRSSQRVPLAAGFGVGMLVYMKVLLDQTGNPIYPAWWNFIGHAGGQWGTPTITAGQAAMRPLFGALLAISLTALAWTLWKRPSSYMLLTFGFGYWAFATGTYGFTAFLSDWQWWMPITRRFEFPWLFLAVLAAVVLLRWMPVRFGPGAMPAAWAGIAVALVASQLAWVPIAQVFGPTGTKWQTTMTESETLGAWYRPYSGHAMAVPSDRPDITYGLAVLGHVDGRHLVSEMYDPFAYLPSGYSYQQHQANVDALLRCWLDRADVRIIAISSGDAQLTMARQLHPDWFTPIGYLTDAQWDVEAVAVPPPTAQECAAAASAAR